MRRVVGVSGVRDQRERPSRGSVPSEPRAPHHPRAYTLPSLCTRSGRAGLGRQWAPFGTNEPPDGPGWPFFAACLAAGLGPVVGTLATYTLLRRCGVVF